MGKQHNSLNVFIRLSVELTGFSQAELEGTGMAEVYFDVVNKIVDSEIIGAMLLEYQSTIVEQDRQPCAVCKQLTENEMFSPLIKNIVTLWYLGQWNQMPRDWRNLCGANALDRDHVVSGEAYRQGLAWIAMGAHPMGTKQQGYGAWSLSPALPPKQILLG